MYWTQGRTFKLVHIFLRRFKFLCTICTFVVENVTQPRHAVMSFCAKMFVYYFRHHEKGFVFYQIFWKLIIAFHSSSIAVKSLAPHSGTWVLGSPPFCARPWSSWTVYMITSCVSRRSVRDGSADVRPDGAQLLQDGDQQVDLVARMVALGIDGQQAPGEMFQRLGHG